MLVTVLVAVLFALVGTVVVVRGSLAILRRLGLDPVAVMLWLGLAERPLTPRRARPRLAEILGEAPSARAPGSTRTAA